MSNVDSPAVARRRVRLALRAAREEKQLTQGQVAEAMGWSISKVIRIEKGEVNVSPGDLTVLLSHLDITDPTIIAELAASAQVSRRERWTVSAEEREFYTPAMIELVQFEAEALTIRYYSNQVIPGIVQTRAYARAVFDNAPEHLSPAIVAARIELRQRRRRVLYRPDPPDCLALLDESVLYRVLGNAVVMAEQLDLMLAMIAEGRLKARIVPFERVSALLFLGPFTAVAIDEERSALVYRESLGSDEVVHAQAEVDRHHETFDQIWDIALDQRATVELIEQRAAYFKAAAGP